MNKHIQSNEVLWFSMVSYGFLQSPMVFSLRVVEEPWGVRIASCLLRISFLQISLEFEWKSIGICYGLSQSIFHQILSESLQMLENQWKHTVFAIKPSQTIDFYQFFQLFYSKTMQNHCVLPVIPVFFKKNLQKYCVLPVIPVF